ASVVVLPLAVSIARLRSAYARVGASERLFRQGFADALLGTVLLRRCEQAGQGGLHHVEHHGVGLDVVEVNDVAARMLGLTPDQLSGTSFTERLQSGDRPLIADAVEAIGTGAVQGWHGELALPGGDGTRWIEVALSPLSAPAGDGLFVAQMVDVTARRAAEERLTVAALHDALTGLANRTLLRDRIDLALATLPDDGSGVAVLFCDLDDFKRVNDSAGHSSGDVVLVEVAARLRAMLRPDDVAARLGGDEFVILRPHVADVSHADALAGSVLESLARPLLVGGQVTTMGASIGIAWGVQGATADDLLRDADAAMYAAKASGKRRAVVYADEHRTRALRSVRVEAELRTALDRGELEMYLQPVVEVLGGQVVAAEALVRWRHPEQGVLAPAAWLDVAEGSGLMPQLGEWVLRRSCEMARTWPCAPGGQALVVHVNVSARQLEVPGFVDLVRAVLDETGLPPASLTLEFTETYLEEVTSALVADLNSLRAMGVGLAADDFGTGYSPLTRILETPLTMIKIDRRFVSSMLDDARSGAVVRALLRLGESLGIAVVAEGVETQAEAHALATLGCRHAQGYLWSRPLPPEAFVQWLATDEARLAGVRAIGAAHADGATHLGAATHPGSAVRLSPRASG
ncbi:MAG: EAL domain-containing protein, partial [Cellulomonadaceae bacterium]|nr:EAL domain-containing protein [Cellulomonadaceae bacterium]